MYREGVWGPLLPHNTPAEGFAILSPALPLGEAVAHALCVLPTGPGTPFFIPAPPDTNTEDNLACQGLRLTQGASSSDPMHPGGWNSPSESGELTDSSPSECFCQAGSGSNSGLNEPTEGRCGAIRDTSTGMSAHQHLRGVGGCSHILCPCRHSTALRKWRRDSSPPTREQGMGKHARSCPSYTGPTCCYCTSCIVDCIKHSPADCPHGGTCFFCEQGHHLGIQCKHPHTLCQVDVCMVPHTHAHVGFWCPISKKVFNEGEYCAAFQVGPDWEWAGEDHVEWDNTNGEV
jgi:hypothetical protein